MILKGVTAMKFNSQKNYADAAFESDLLEGNINRMFTTDNIEEFERMRKFAHLRIERIYSIIASDRGWPEQKESS